MNLHKLLLAPILFCAACAATIPVDPTTPHITNGSYDGLNYEALSTFHATFLLRFEGESEWLYRLDIRSDGQNLERHLHLEGVSAAQNPGDVRLVSTDGITRMRGPGTEDVCLQFPTQLDLGPAFLSPDQIFNPEDLTASLLPADGKQLLGIQTSRYSYRAERLKNWQEPQVDIWMDPISGAVLRYDLRVRGEDPLFNAGEGMLTGLYLVNDFGPQTIEPIAGCELEIPLPDDATDLVKLPGLVAFKSGITASDAVSFYQNELPILGWEPSGDPDRGLDATLLSYLKGVQSLEINIEPQERGVTIEVLLENE